MRTDTQASRPTPRVFISYSWDDDPHKDWVKVFATRLRSDGVDVTLDQWHLQPGDQLPAFMEGAVRENDYVLIVCTPTYADRSNRRVGGVGYEGDIMTGEVFTSRNERKFIPVWRRGAQWNVAAPSWLLAKYRIDLRGDPFSEQQYQDLLITLHGMRPVAPPIGPRRPTPSARIPTAPQSFTFEPIRILGVVVDEVEYAAAGRNSRQRPLPRSVSAIATPIGRMGSGIRSRLEPSHQLHDCASTRNRQCEYRQGDPGRHNNGGSARHPP